MEGFREEETEVARDNMTVRRLLVEKGTVIVNSVVVIIKSHLGQQCGGGRWSPRVEGQEVFPPEYIIINGDLKQGRTWGSWKKLRGLGRVRVN